MVNVAPLWTSQIDSVLNHHPLTEHLFRGTFACDLLPTPFDGYTHLHQPWICVTNTQPSTQAGEHWILLGSNEPTTLNMFDSYGMDLLTFYNNPWISNFVKHFHHVEQNTNQYQGWTTNVCGHYCIYAAAYRGLLGT